MKTLTAKILMLAVLLPLAAQAQTSAPAEFTSVRFAASNNPSASSTASFAWGMSLDGGSTYVSTARTTDTVKVLGRIRPEASAIGSKGDLYVVDFVNGQWTMQNSSGAFVPWDFVVPNLVPYKEQVTLTADTPLDVFTGKLSTSGDHRFYIGYKANGGNLHYTPSSQKLTITAVSATDQAYDKFVSSISPNIIGSRCIACHVKGGQADGKAMHIFTVPLTSNLQTNFKTFQNLVSNKGVTYILTKVIGGNNHGGGVQLTASSADYKELQSFLTLVAQGVPDLSSQNSSSTTDNNYTDPYANNPYGY